MNLQNPQAVVWDSGQGGKPGTTLLTLSSSERAMFPSHLLSLLAIAVATLHAMYNDPHSYGNYMMLSANIDQFPPPANDNTTINENFAIIAQGTRDGSLPVECGAVWNVTAPTPQRSLSCTDPAVEVVVSQMHTSPEYGFDLYFMLK